MKLIEFEQHGNLWRCAYIPVCKHIYQCASLYTSVQAYIQVYRLIYECASLYTSVQAYIPVCKLIYQCASVYASVQAYIQVCKLIYQCTSLYTSVQAYIPVLFYCVYMLRMKSIININVRRYNLLSWLLHNLNLKANRTDDNMSDRRGF